MHTQFSERLELGQARAGQFHIDKFGGEVTVEVSRSRSIGILPEPQ